MGGCGEEPEANVDRTAKQNVRSPVQRHTSDISRHSYLYVFVWLSEMLFPISLQFLMGGNNCVSCGRQSERKLQLWCFNMYDTGGELLKGYREF